MQAWDVNEVRRAWGHKGDQAEGQEPRLHGQGQTKDLSQRKCQRRRSRAGKGKQGGDLELCSSSVLWVDVDLLLFSGRWPSPG